MYTNVTYVWAKLNISTAVQSAGDEVSILNSMDKKPVILQVEVVGAGGSTPDMDINISRKPLSVAFPALSSASLHRNRSLNIRPASAKSAVFRSWRLAFEMVELDRMARPEHDGAESGHQLP